MALDEASFRETFPEFSDAARYPTSRIALALNEASVRLLPSVWGELLDTGTAYFVAHRLAQSSPLTPGSNGGPATASVAVATGLVTSKGAGPLSKSMDVSVGQTEGAGDFNLTPYGQTFAAMAATVAVGAIQF